jgi:hypothetical protein
MVTLVLVSVFFCMAIFAFVQGPKARLILTSLSILACVTVGFHIAQPNASPIESAETAVPNTGVVRLEYWGVADFWGSDFGRRYLILKDGGGEIRKSLPDADWIHWPRASVYETGDGRIALLTAAFDDHVIDPVARTIESLRRGAPSENWTYLGAFDLDEKYKGLKFFSASAHRECTDTLGKSISGMTRPQGRALDCRLESLRR